MDEHSNGTDANPDWDLKVSAPQYIICLLSRTALDGIIFPRLFIIWTGPQTWWETLVGMVHSFLDEFRSGLFGTCILYARSWIKEIFKLNSCTHQTGVMC